jgi:hypothetical protein
MPGRDPIGSFRRVFKNSPWLVISVLAHVILLVGLGLFALKQAMKPKPVDTTFVRITHPVETPPEEAIPMPEPIVRDVLPQNPSILTDPDDTYFPPDTAWNEQGSPDAGNPDASDIVNELPPSSSAIAVGTGPGGIRGTSPTPFTHPFGTSGRLREKRGDGTPLGPTVPIDKAVRHGLLWLCRHQNPDGSWSPRSMQERCDPKSPCLDPRIAVNDHYDEGLTSLAVLAFLGAGMSHTSDLWLVDARDAKRYRTGDVVKKGLQWLRDRQNPDGSFSKDRPFLYNEALATMALSEAYGMTGAKYWQAAAQRGVEFVQRAQRPSPTSGTARWGWRYGSRDDVEHAIGSATDPDRMRQLYDADTSVTTWCVMALKSAELSKLAVDPSSLAGALDFAKFVTADDGGVGYLDKGGAGASVSGPFSEAFNYHPTTMCALGMCIRIFAAHDPTDPILDLSAKKIVADLPTYAKDPKTIDYYYWYYASLALNQLDGPDSPRKSGKYWNPWNKAMVEALLALQDGTQGSCREGGWTMNDRWASASGAGAIYSTAMSVLTLEVYYRYPNAFGRRRA